MPALTVPVAEAAPPLSQQLSMLDDEWWELHAPWATQQDQLSPKSSMANLAAPQTSRKKSDGHLNTRLRHHVLAP